MVVQAFSRASQKAADDLLPPSAAEFDSKPVKLIIGLCAELAALNGDQKRFFLSGHVAAKLLKSYPKQVYGWLGMLVVEGVIEVVQKRQSTSGHPLPLHRGSCDGPNMPKPSLSSRLSDDDAPRIGY